MPIPIVSVQEMRTIEAAADDGGLSYAEMMERAGSALAARLTVLLSGSGLPRDQWRVTFLIGPGNNGGDGLVAGRRLAAETGALVRFYLLKDRAEDDPHLQSAGDAGLLIAEVRDDQRFRVLQQMVSTSAIVVDALFGIGARLPLNTDTRRLLAAVKAALSSSHPPPPAQLLFADDPATARPFRPLVLAVDCPSGLDCDTGAIDDAALAADETLTMIAVKPGLLTFPGASHTGRLAISDLGVPPSIEALKTSRRHLVTASDVAGWLPPRPPDSHKGSFGRVLIAGGSANYSGAPALAARAACRMGAGLVTIGAPTPVVEILAGGLHEITWLHLPHDLGALTADGLDLLRAQARHADSLVLGMGIGREPSTRDLLDGLLSAGLSRHAGIGFAPGPATESASDACALPPLILDADALSLLVSLPDWAARLPPGTILTPHPGEMARLCGRTTQEVVQNRWTLAEEMAATWNVTLVLKGAHTLIASPYGRVRVLPFKTAALATAGTGDVLAGMIGALRAQGLPPADAASAAGWLHGLAGVLAAQKLGSERAVCAGDVVEAIPAALAALGV